MECHKRVLDVFEKRATLDTTGVLNSSQEAYEFLTFLRARCTLHHTLQIRRLGKRTVPDKNIFFFFYKEFDLYPSLTSLCNLNSNLILTLNVVLSLILILVLSLTLI